MSINRKIFSILNSMCSLTMHNCDENNVVCYSYIRDNYVSEYGGHPSIEDAANYIMNKLFGRDLQHSGVIDDRLLSVKLVKFDVDHYCCVSNKIYITHFLDLDNGCVMTGVFPHPKLVTNSLTDYRDENFNTTDLERIIMNVIETGENFKRPVNVALVNDDDEDMVWNLVISVDVY